MKYIHHTYPPSAIGQFVRQRRKSRRLTQAQLAALVGVGTRVVCELERGKPAIQMDTVNRILAVFGKTLGIVDAPRPAPTAETDVEPS